MTGLLTGVSRQSEPVTDTDGCLLIQTLGVCRCHLRWSYGPRKPPAGVHSTCLLVHSARNVEGMFASMSVQQVRWKVATFIKSNCMFTRQDMKSGFNYPVDQLSIRVNVSYCHALNCQLCHTRSMPQVTLMFNVVMDVFFSEYDFKVWFAVAGGPR